MGITCVKDFVITYNYKIVPYMAMPVIMLLLISYFRRMYDDNRMVRYVNVRKFYLAVIAGGAVRIAKICIYYGNCCAYRRDYINTWNYE